METMGGWRCRCFGSLDVTLGLLADVATGPLSTRQATARLPQATLAKHGAQGVHSPTATPRNTSRYAKTDVHPVRPSAHIVMASKKPAISVFRHPHPFPRVMPLLVAWLLERRPCHGNDFPKAQNNTGIALAHAHPRGSFVQLSLSEAAGLALGFEEAEDVIDADCVVPELASGPFAGGDSFGKPYLGP